jgi:hypothetical protein
MILDETLAASIWQRSFRGRVIRDEREWSRIRAYIETDPVNWARDEENQGK